MSTSPVTAGKVGYDLLMGDIVYAPCGHTFSYAHDRSLERTGVRSAQDHHCPRCAQPGPGTCLMCLNPWTPDATATATCACGMYFDSRVRDARRAEFEGRGLRVGTDTRRFAAQKRTALRNRAVRKERFLALTAREKTAAEAEAADDGAIEEGAADVVDDEMTEENAVEERSVDGKKKLE